MSLLNGFIKQDLNKYTQGRILETIENLKREGRESAELSFNVYSVTLSPLSNEVVISNDVEFEIPAERIQMDKFIEIISRFT